MTLQTYIAEGFMDDCEELIHTITEKFEKVDWHKFCYFWKEMEFDILFYGRQSGPEVVEFTEEILQTARLYMITETDNFESQVVGLFIAYAITLIQPYKNLVSLRLVPSDVAALKKFEIKLREDGRKDALYILGKMYLVGKMQFHVALRERAMDVSIRKYFDGSTNVPVGVSRRWHGILDRTRIKMLENIAQEEEKYMEIKTQAKLAAEAIFPGTNVQVDMFKSKAKIMAESLRKLTTKLEEGETKDDDHEVSYVNKVKQKAMKKTVDPMKHLHSVADRKKDKEKKPAAPSKPSPKTYKNCRKVSSPKLKEEPFIGGSLPSLDDTPQTELNTKSDDFEVPFKGFSKEEIESCQFNQNSSTKPVANGYHGKGKGEGKTSKKITTSPVLKQPYKGRSPRYNRKRNNSDDKRKKRKNKLNKKLRLSNDFNSDDSNTSIEISYTSEDEASENDETFDFGKENENAIKVTTENIDSEVDSSSKVKADKPTIKNISAKKLNTKTSKGKEKKTAATTKVLSKKINSETCKSKEFTVQSKGVVKHFVEYEVNDNIVIRTEKDAPPLKDIEIEYIDNYTGANTYEELCEISDDDETNKKDKSDTIITENSEVISQNVNAPIEDEIVDTNNDIEVFEVVNEDTRELNINTSGPSSSNSYDTYLGRYSINGRQAYVDETVKRILSKNTKHNIDRRQLKQPRLRSKWKKMGLLSIANFDDDN